ncbi:uncharacterized protein F4807DRAFT_314212 [Annulohypoxylon truncatum]|uniref:uncharacterized protein n=1 Tax=Annulohypoxylon truncatum TaxID=327061 RepID=UPI0020081804|nr:uncharacterized protein F4807DRAFT_314212 [Annulohypoxylon truncatum]KAI1204844.1 hypothetical protein F4807DRAFT_314212 [Annulohypoxylon truncatum]
MLKRMNAPRRPIPVAAAAVPAAPRATTTTTPSRCPPLPLEIWTQIMRTLVHSEDLPELWMGLRLLSHTLKAALETAFVDEHLTRLRGWLYVGDPQTDARRPWNSSQAGAGTAKRIVPLQLVLSRFSPDRRRAYFVSLLHRNDPSLKISPRFAECSDNTVVAEWLRSARGVPPPGAGPTEGRLRLTIGPDCAWTHWKHHVIGSDGFVVESRNITFEDEDADEWGSDGRGDSGGRRARGKGARAIGLEVDRTKCEVSLEWTTLVSCVFARPRKTFGEAFHAR